MIYLDHAATTPVYPQVTEAMLPYFTKQFFNPSSGYLASVSVHKEIEKIREQIAESIHAKANEIYFTGGGTESDNWILNSTAQSLASNGKHIITSAIEHHAILNTCAFLERQGYEVTYLPVDKEGYISLKDLEQAIRDDTILISIMFGNNEIGTLEPVQKIGQIARKHGVLFHTDSVQVYGHLPINVEEDTIDYLSVSAHKFGGPKGIGFLYARESAPLLPFIQGGGQESNHRAGTENVPGIIGMGKACELALKYQSKEEIKVRKLRDYLQKRLLSEIPFAHLNGARVNRLPGNLNISFPFVEGGSLLVMLEMEGIYASSGSACNTGSHSPSHVLKAIGLSEELIHGAIRLTIGPENSRQEMDFVAEEIKKDVKSLRELSQDYMEITSFTGQNTKNDLL